MSFVAPMAFFFAAALPVVVVFYLLKRKRVVRLVSSTLLWQKFLADTQASAPFQRLRHNWLLILQLLLLSLVILALARPYLAGETRRSRLRVLILDASASMQSRDVKPSRFEEARAQALRWVEGLGDRDQMVVVQAAASTEVMQSATTEKAALRRALERCRVTDAPTRLVEAFKLAETLTRDQADSDIHLFSDGALPNLADFENKNLPLVYHRIGERSENAGIVSVDVRANPEDAAQRAVFVSVLNAGSAPRPAELELRFGGELLEVRPVVLPATNSVPLVFLTGQTNDGVFSVRLTGADDLPADDEVYAVSLMPRPARVLLATRGNRFLERALRGVGQVELTVVTTVPEEVGAVDVVVLDNVVPLVWPELNTLAFHTTRTNWFAGWGTVRAPLIVDWKATHPLLRFVNFDNVQVSQSLKVPPPEWGTVLVESAETPLMVAGELERQRLIWVGFDLLESTWPLRISFPIFLANAVEWLNPAANAKQLMVRAGDPFRLALGPEVGTARVRKPDGAKVSVGVEAKTRELIFGETAARGVYLLEAGTNSAQFCVNLMDAAESHIQPRDELPFGRYGKVPAAVGERANRELWRWLALAGLVVVLFEWWFYHRRTA